MTTPVAEHPEGKHLPDDLGETRHGLTFGQSQVADALNAMRARDAEVERLLIEREASRRGSLFIVGGGAFWIGLLIALFGPASAGGSFVLISTVPGWPIFYGAVLCGLGVGVWATRSRVGRLTEVLIAATAVWYIAFSATFIVTWTGVYFGVIASADLPALYAGAVYFTLALFSLKARKSLREARANRER